MIFSRRSKVVVDAFTYMDHYAKFSKIDKAAKFFPQWFKDTPSTFKYGVTQVPTIKSCDGFINYYKNSFIMPLWTDFAIEIRDGAYRWKDSDGFTESVVHDYHQWNNFVSEKEYGHLKLVTPWNLVEKSDIKFLLQRPFWNYKPTEETIITPGSVGFKYQASTHINMLFPITKNQEILLKFNDPILHMIPLTEKEVEIRTHVVSRDEYNKYTKPNVSFIDSFGKVKKMLQSQEKKCPFHFK